MVNKAERDAALCALEAHAKQMPEDNFIIVLSAQTGGKFRALHSLSIRADGFEENSALCSQKIYVRRALSLIHI